MFKKESKKSAVAPLPPPPTDGNLEDELFAQLDAQDQAQAVNGTLNSSTTLATTNSAESGQSNKLQKPKKDPKFRFKAREVGVSSSSGNSPNLTFPGATFFRPEKCSR